MRIHCICLEKCEATDVVFVKRIETILFKWRIIKVEHRKGRMVMMYCHGICVAMLTALPMRGRGGRRRGSLETRFRGQNLPGLYYEP